MVLKEVPKGELAPSPRLVSQMITLVIDRATGHCCLTVSCNFCITGGTLLFKMEPALSVLTMNQILRSLLTPGENTEGTEMPYRALSSKVC